MSDKPMTTADVRQMLKDQRVEAAPAEPAAPGMTVADVALMLKGLPWGADAEKAALAQPSEEEHEPTEPSTTPVIPKRTPPPADKGKK